MVEKKKKDLPFEQWYKNIGNRQHLGMLQETLYEYALTNSKSIDYSNDIDESFIFNTQHGKKYCVFYFPGSK